MIQAGTYVKIVDKSGGLSGQCIKVLGHTGSRIAKITDVVLVSIKSINIKRVSFMKERKRKRFTKGRIHRAMLIRSKVNYKRAFGIYTRFDENSVVIVNKLRVPMSNRVYGPVFKEICMR